MIITKGKHPWNLCNWRKDKRECPKCNGLEINNNTCVKCGYSPDYQTVKLEQKYTPTLADALSNVKQGDTIFMCGGRVIE
jgi:hypothetical protein